MKYKRKPLLVFIISLFLLIPFSFFIYSAHFKKTTPEYNFSEIIGGILESESPLDYKLFTSTINTLSQGQDEEYTNNLNLLLDSLNKKKIPDVVIKGNRDSTLPYKGIYLNDVRDMRYSLSHIDKIKQAGIDTILFEVQREVDPKTLVLYVPGEETYLFYLNSFHKSGFRIWLTVGHTSYNFPYRADSDTENIEIKPLDNQKELLEMVKPNIYKWAEISEKYNVDTFIPEEEANTLLVDSTYQGSDLCQSERILLNNWMQEILPEIKTRFSGKLGFATNDGGPCERIGTSDTRLGPDFNYQGYDFILYKFPFRSVMESDQQWQNHVSYSIPNTLTFVSRDNLDGLILYEAGDTVGEPIDQDFAGSIPVRETDELHQKESYEKYFEILDGNDEVIGLFFKISDIQPHEPSWNPFGNPAEEVLKNNFASSDVLPLTEFDKMWVSIGEDGLKAIQYCIDDDMPFDPEYELEREGYEDLIKKVEPLCK